MPPLATFSYKITYWITFLTQIFHYPAFMTIYLKQNIHWLKGPLRRTPMTQSPLHTDLGSTMAQWLAWSLYKCLLIWRAFDGASATERPLGNIRKKKGISSQFQVSISSRYDLSCNVKTIPFAYRFYTYGHTLKANQ